MEEVLGASWKANLYPAPAEKGGFTNLQQQAAKVVQARLREYVIRYLSQHVLHASALPYMNALVVALYPIALYPEWSLHDVITNRLMIEDDQGMLPRPSTKNLAAWGNLLDLDPISQKEESLLQTISDSGVGVATIKLAKSLKPKQILRDILTSFLQGFHQSASHNPYLHALKHPEEWDSGDD